MKARKSLGQNFLMHRATAERIAEVAHLGKEDTVLEIGPGTGMLTRALLTRARKVVAVEADPELCKTLRETFAGEIARGRLELVEQDIRSFDLASLPAGYALVANIPYYLTGEIFRRFLENENQPRAMTLLVQKEVAERVAPKQLSEGAAGRTAGGGGRRAPKGSILSLAVQAYGAPKYEFTVPRGAFRPAPGVDSAVLSVRDISRSRFLSRAEEERFFAVLHAGFAHKRKFLASNLAAAGFSGGAVPEKARAEDLPLADWLRLARL